ncbi:hypothetical protein DERF_002832 [Dermatophagoides farinae]|uniref:Uncharacterized protein n=1 Tax=Dermatophagoides farinae TaxID=6954 RepID=A0A922LDE8_DERFA|nr:hypothetical protein DERF_002832 [Dermatophagoides farinae]
MHSESTAETNMITGMIITFFADTYATIRDYDYDDDDDDDRKRGDQNMIRQSRQTMMMRKKKDG